MLKNVSDVCLSYVPCGHDRTSDKSKAEKEGRILGDGLRAHSMTAEDLEVMVTLCVLLTKREMNSCMWLPFFFFHV